MLLTAGARLDGGTAVTIDQPELSPAEVVITWLDAHCRRGESGSVVLIEEPELDLNPQTQRYFYRVMRHSVNATRSSTRRDHPRLSMPSITLRSSAST